MVNKTREELQNMYPDFTIEEFSETNIVLQKQEEGRCDEHFVVKDENSNIMIYKENQESTSKESKIQESELKTLKDIDFDIEKLALKERFTKEKQSIENFSLSLLLQSL